jgi:hypothetical protein
LQSLWQTVVASLVSRHLPSAQQFVGMLLGLLGAQIIYVDN